MKREKCIIGIARHLVKKMFNVGYRKKKTNDMKATKIPHHIMKKTY